MAVLFEGGQASVDAQAAALGGEETAPWEQVRALQASLPGRIRWDGDEAPLVRPGPRVAYVEERVESEWSPLAQRILEAFCNPT